ncbi:MAG TPA: sugar ABC transporter permease [Candidatus Gallacutalibacter pullicola]|uniref:Sugar ABC transporter permease n=1 Tax=Candidatus Gallacutalibacter pullicola TaxID=2840830 RepID=A0A9D1J0W4_9FIRM|nr:sugar ABC transporter permease [Candidatus Gallacutalibacter pullicola]
MSGGLKTWKRDFRHCWQMWILLLPALIWLVVFCYTPMYGLLIAFKDYKANLGILGSPWAGLKYFRQFFETDIAFTSIVNTIRISGFSLLFSFPIPILFALMLNQISSSKVRKFLQSVSFMPYFISAVVLVGMLNIILSPTTGFVNVFLNHFGMGGKMFMTREEYFLPIYILSGIWQSMGFNAIVYIAALTTIDTALYEAATIDGASKFKQILYIEIPSILPTIIVMFILATGNMLSVGYEKVYLMQSSLNLSVSEVVSTYVYKVGIQSAQFSFATAVGLFNSVANFLIIFVTNAISRRISDISLF